MNTVQQRVACAFAAMLLPLSVWAQPVTLEEAVATALQHNERVKQYHERVEQRQYGVYESWGNFLPNISVTGTYNHLNDPVVFDLSPIRSAIIQLQAKDAADMKNLSLGGAMTPAQYSAYMAGAAAQLNAALPQFKETLKDQDYKSAAFVGIQPVFLGGKLLAAKNAAADEKRAAEYELDKTRSEVAADAVNAYLTVVLLNDVVRTRQNVLDGIGRHRNDAKKLYEQGLISHNQLLRAEVAFAEAERALFDDRNNLSLALIALKNALGMDDSRDLSVQDTFRFTPYTNPVANELNQAYAAQPILKMIAEKRDAANQKYRAEFANYLPSVAVFGKYELYPQYLSVLEPRWIVGVQASYTLFNGLQRYTRLQAASHLEQEVEYLEADAKRKVTLWVNKAYKEMENARERYAKLQTNLLLAKENLRSNDTRFQSGLGTSLEVIDAQLALEKIEIDLKTSLYTYYKAVNDLGVATGNSSLIVSLWNRKENAQ